MNGVEMRRACVTSPIDEFHEFRENISSHIYRLVNDATRNRCNEVKFSRGSIVLFLL